MRKITPFLTKELLKHYKDRKAVAQAEAFPVTSFINLLKIAAQLAYLNKDFLLFYRGQSQDYKNKTGKSTFYPSIYRNIINQKEIVSRFEILDNASKDLIKLFDEHKITGSKDVKNRKSIRWSILQHYEVCGTPFLDFTQSIRVACSFATLDTSEDYAYVYIFGFPYLTNRISINSEHDLINIRLLSICPPSALRPYCQEGYLAGTDEVTDVYEKKEILDFNNRLIAKFRIPTTPDFWAGSGLTKIDRNFLYPEKDPISDICKTIVPYIEVNKKLKPETIGTFLQFWNELENYLIHKASEITNSQQIWSPYQSIKLLNKIEPFSNYTNSIELLRRTRNNIVHQNSNVTNMTNEQLEEIIDKLKNVISTLGVKDEKQTIKQSIV